MVRLIPWIAALVATITTYLTRRKQSILERAAQTHDENLARFSDMEAHLQFMIESAKDYAIFSLDPNGLVTTWNSGAERVFGFREHEILGKHTRIIFTPEDQATGVPEREIQQARTAGYSQNERWHVRKGQKRFFASGMLRPMRDKDGTLRGFIKIARDITHRIEAEQERIELLKSEQEARAAAEQANQAKLQFVAMISHELRTPLTSIKGFATTLLAEDVQFSPHDQRDFLRIISSEADKLDDLISQLSDISRMQAGTLRVTTIPTPLNSILDAALPTIRTLTASHHWEMMVAPGLPDIMADRDRAVQVLINLVENAVKYSPQGTTIRLNIQRDSAFVQFDVTDEGIGIDPDFRELVFEPFQRIDQAYPKGGSGLGLAICKGLVQAQDGQIWIHDRPTSGTTVSFTLPIAFPES